MDTKFKYQLFPNLSTDELQKLEASILAHGILHPICRDTEGNILDGHHRMAICIKHNILCPEVTTEFANEQGKEEFVLTMNLARRHLSKDDQLKFWLRLRQLGMSIPMIAKTANASQSTVGRAIKDAADTAAANGETIQPATIVGKDGKTRSSTISEEAAAANKRRADAKARKEELDRLTASSPVVATSNGFAIHEAAGNSASMGNTQVRPGVNTTGDSQPKPTAVSVIHPPLGTPATLVASIIEHYTEEQVDDIISMLQRYRGTDIADTTEEGETNEV